MPILSVGRTEAGLSRTDGVILITIFALFCASVFGALQLREALQLHADPSYQTKARAQFFELVQELAEFKFDTGTFPTTAQGLKALRVRPENVNNWKGPYTSRGSDLDVWFRPYVYKCPGDHGEYDLLSYGGDGKPGGEGINADIVNWKH